MTDRELLELAAKAAGFTDLIHWVDENKDYDSHLYGLPCLCQEKYGGPYEVAAWNPLLDDGDALRLSVVIGMVVNTMEGISTAFVGRHTCCVELHGSDPYESTRRAIVRAAAEIGKNMK